MVFVQERWLCLECNNTIPDENCTFCNHPTEKRKLFPTKEDKKRYQGVADIENSD